jgi:SAM-dependent methyltransferase
LEQGLPGHESHGLGSGAWDEATAQWYARNYGDHPSNAMTVAVAELRPDDVVLDIGCGSGSAVREAARIVLAGQVLGLDPTPAMLQIAAQHTSAVAERERVHFLVGSAEHIPLPDDSVGVALAINSLHHWQDWQRGLADARRVLRPGGRLWISEEALSGGRFGHSDGPLSDPRFVAQGLRAAGFVQVAVGTQEAGETTICYVVGTTVREVDG